MHFGKPTKHFTPGWCAPSIGEEAEERVMRLVGHQSSETGSGMSSCPKYCCFLSTALRYAVQPECQQHSDESGDRGQQDSEPILQRRGVVHLQILPTTATVMTMLTYREAAKLVRRSRRTIRHWKLQGMRMEWDRRDGQRVRVVDEAVLIAWWHERMDNDPVWQNRIRAKIAAAQQADTPIAKPVLDPAPFAAPTLMVVQVSHTEHHTHPQR
jgi:hypothetical protein